MQHTANEMLVSAEMARHDFATHFSGLVDAQLGWIGDSGARLPSRIATWANSAGILRDRIVSHGELISRAARELQLADDAGAEALNSLAVRTAPKVLNL